MSERGVAYLRCTPLRRLVATSFEWTAPGVSVSAMPPSKCHPVQYRWVHAMVQANALELSRAVVGGTR
eukprot:6490933-Amphidinium_carterae.1